MADSSRISPTAHYTSYVWVKHGLSHPSLGTPLGRILYHALAPMNLAYDRLSDRPSLEVMLLSRHRGIDHLLARAIEEKRVGQVIEVAAGLSPRGLTFTRRFPGLTYVEADLPAMAARKRAALAVAGAKHRVVEVDALKDGGPGSLDEIAAGLDPKVGTAIITEGLLGYFSRPDVEGMWRRFARVLGRFPSGLYLADLNLGGDLDGMRGARLFKKLLEVFARGKTYLHFGQPEEAEAAARAAGFRTVRVHRPSEMPAEVDIPARHRRANVRVLEATT
jgi:O-methyltransferase involved in polyketide biosynthesis